MTDSNDNRTNRINCYLVPEAYEKLRALEIALDPAKPAPEAYAW